MSVRLDHVCNDVTRDTEEKGETNEKLRKVMNDPTLEGKNENEAGRVQPKPVHALED